MCDSGLIGLVAFMEMAWLIANVYFTKYYVSTVGSLCFMFPLGRIWQPSVYGVQSHSNRIILALLTMLYPCVRRNSDGVSCLMCIVANPSSYHCHEIRYQKHLCSERLPPVLNSLSSESWAIASTCLLNFVLFWRL